MPRRRGQYNQVASTEEEGGTNQSTETATVEEFQDEPSSGEAPSQTPPPSSETPLVQTSSSAVSKQKKKLKTIDELKNDGGDRITIHLMDTRQTIFEIPANPDWTVMDFKRLGETIHKCPPAQQRLIYHGKMLADASTLKASGLVKNKVIVHLFPKPRVVVTNSASAVSNDSSPSTAGQQSQGEGNDNGENSGPSASGGAHVPQIVLDEHEAERRGQILVLGNPDIQDAQNNVKLLSLLLLVICSMRLLALFSIAMGVAADPEALEDDLVPQDYVTDDHGGFPGDNGSSDMDYEPRTWEDQDYFDLAVSVTGFYVATLGMKATTENTLQLANAYLIGCFIAGIGWNMWNAFMYVVFVEDEIQETKDTGSDGLSRDDFATVAFFTVLLPILVWVLCCFRAWEFRRLIEEAEEEAAERIRSQLALSEHNGDAGDDDEDPSGSRELTELNPSSSGAEVV